MVAGMQHHQSHPGQHALLHPVDDRVLNLVMRHVTPPGQNVGAVEQVLRQALVRIINRAALNEKAAIREASGDSTVHAVRVDPGNRRVILLVPAFVPDRQANSHVWSPFVRWR